MQLKYMPEMAEKQAENQKGSDSAQTENYPVSMVWENANMGMMGVMGRIGENALDV